MADVVTDDPYLWLEEVEGEAAVAWVEAQNARTAARLCDAAFPEEQATVQRLMESDDRIPNIIQRGDFVYNFWTDAAHPRGVWRRTTLEDYRQEQPAWDVLLDIDALGAAEGESWVWHGAKTLAPDHNRALVVLSPGGSDASATREFDLVTRQFVQNGFSLPVAKNTATWLDADTLLVAPAYDGDVTTSGYPRTVRRLERGMALAAAPVVFEVEKTDMWAGVMVSHDPAYPFTLFTRMIAFWRNIYVYEADGKRVTLDVPENADIEIAHGRLAVAPRTDWQPVDKTYPAGSLLVIGMDKFLAGGRDFAVLFTPAARSALNGWTSLASGVVVSVMENVASRLFFAPATDWRAAEIPGLPTASSVSVSKLNPSDPASEALLFHVDGFLTPPRQLLGTPAGASEVLKTLPPQFDSAGMSVEQLEATAADGTKIQYFLIGAPGEGQPVYLYGYGGFEVSLGPHYAAQMGAVWCAKGGRYAVANIRGGGEFGPAWHRAGIREKKRIAQDDFAAVAADIEVRGIAPRHRILGAGGSNGGLLIGNMLTRHPAQFAALICTVPLLDMQRYTKLLAGASWIAEYGDPDIPEDWAFLKEISAYQLAAPGQAYPPILIATTRRDDRVHPGHARKMAAKLQDMGYDALYFEQAEGGHGAGADAAQRAFFVALEYAFARQTVGAGLTTQTLP
jgi:prolyl oligopeptidase